jgi:hypothetical protein
MKFNEISNEISNGSDNENLDSINTKNKPII